MTEAFQSRLKRIQLAGLFAGIIGLGLCALAGRARTPQFFASYLFAYLFWLGLALGCFGVAMIHHLTGGRWGNATRRFLEAGFMTLPLMALLFLPIFFGLHQLYPWAQPATVAADKVLQARAAYMNVPGFTFRVVTCFGIWIVMAWLLRKWSLEQDRTMDPMPTRRMRALSGPGMIIYPLTVTFAYVDWVMSLDADWYSTIFVVIVCIGQILAAYAFVVLVLAFFRNCSPVAEVLSPTTLHHLGNLLLAFVIFWTYVEFGQLLIIWSGNLPQEISWYLHRTEGSWKLVLMFLVVFHFFVPFFLLLFRLNKRRIWSLAILAAMLFAARIVNVFWMIMPVFHQSGIIVTWPDFAAFCGIGGVWLALFISILQRSELVPRNDPRMQPAFVHGKQVPS